MDENLNQQRATKSEWVPQSEKQRSGDEWMESQSRYTAGLMSWWEAGAQAEQVSGMSSD